MKPGRPLLCCAVAVAVAGLATDLVAAPAPVAERQALMKQMGFAMRDSTPFANGTAAFDAKKVRPLMQVFVDSSRKLHKLFPADSAADPKTTAGPLIWQNKADFDRRLNELAKAAHGAQKAGDAAAFKAQFSALSATCKSCHDTYRKKKT